MSKASLAIKAAVACTMPLLACSTYYTLERLESADPFLYFAASIALPTSLIGLVGTAFLLTSGKKTGNLLWLAAFSLLAPLILLILIWQ